MAMPRTLKNFNLFNDGESYMGVAEEIKLPKLTRKTDDYRGGGMSGPVAVDLGQEKIELEMTLAGLMRQVFAQYGTTKADGVMLRFAGAYQRDDTAEVNAVEVVVRGRHTEIDPDNAKAGERGKLTVKSALTYYKLSIDGDVVIEIDLLNMVETVNGVDMLAEQRKAIGLA
ncbi:phage major tail tube protein [Immundisolibacter sp.]|uniref:phage major tail tube protein n=1 Tax=Immundisolibacter sp. TaxID=1934948 RepID=UPI00260722DE|nr:phage major tail tube protein [Immundisolibacter sp.]MDD3652400.1 phage major tail tube protein [Immundisolibacter sp.]